MTDRNMPLISVIVPVYMVEKYLDKCVESIVNQTYGNLEIILVDDGSPDQCGAVCDRWARKDRRIKVVHKQNGGLSDARNKGIECSRGEYLCFVDSDDYIEPRMVEELWKALVRTGDSMAVCNFVYEYEGLTEKRRKKKTADYQIKEEKRLSCLSLMKLMNGGKYSFGAVAWNKLYKRGLFEHIRYPAGKIHEDEFVFHQLVYLSGKVSCIPYVGYHYLQHRESIMAEGENYRDALEAGMDRCMFFMEKNERELAVESEKRLLSTAKNAKQSGRLSRTQKKEYISLVHRLYLKKWLPLSVLLKRMIRFWII